MSTLSRSWSRPEPRVAAFAAAALVFLGSWALLHTHHFTAHRLVDTPVYESYGDAMRDGLGAVPRLRRRVPAGRAAGLRRADLRGRLRRRRSAG